MVIKYRTKTVRPLTPEGLKFLLDYSDQKADLLKVLRNLPQTQMDKFLGQEHIVHERVRVFSKGWTERREALRNLFTDRKLRISFSYTSNCKCCGDRYHATSPRKHYCSIECEKKARYQSRLERGEFKDGMARTRHRKRQAAKERAVKQKQIIEEKENLLVENLYQEVVFGKFDKKNRSQYYNICRQLAYGDEVMGYKKIAGWHENKLKFAQIPTEDQNILTTWVRDQK